jgi:hypothetical protein
VAAGLLILVGMIVLALLMLPPYLDDLRLQRAMAGFVAEPGTVSMSEEMIRSQVAERAARLGVPLGASQIRVEKDGSRVRVEAMYAVRMDLPLYSVDLHFHPSAGSR